MISSSYLIDIPLSAYHSLKEKRKLRLSLQTKLKSKFNISIIEADLQDRLDVLRFGISYVSLSAASAETTIDNILDFIFAESGVEAEVVHYGESI